jgi:glucose/arabinose dehydrogenase
VYSHGHRNPQGLIWNANGTILYSSEHNSRGQDEINIIKPVINYGWLEINGDVNESAGSLDPIFSEECVCL